MINTNQFATCCHRPAVYTPGLDSLDRQQVLMQRREIVKQKQRAKNDYFTSLEKIKSTSGGQCSQDKLDHLIKHQYTPISVCMAVQNKGRPCWVTAWLLDVVLCVREINKNTHHNLTICELKQQKHNDQSFNIIKLVGHLCPDLRHTLSPLIFQQHACINHHYQ